MLRRAALRLALLPILLSTWAFADTSQSDSEPRTLLAAMAEANRSLDYQGRFLYMHGNELSTMKVRHAVIDGHEYERLTHLDGQLAELIRRDDQVICIHPDRSITRLPAQSGLAPMPFQDRLDRALPEQYNVLLDGEGRVAGRQTWHLRIAPLDSHRHGYRLWIDQDSKLLLKSEMVDASGMVLERMEFVALDTAATLTADDFATPEAAMETAIEGVEPGAYPQGRLEIDIEWLPEGFAALDRDLRRATPEQVPVSALAYGDGLASFTLFVEPVTAESTVEEGMSRMGPTVAVSRRLEQGDSAWLVTLVGEIPQATAERVLAAASVRLDAAQ
ncbi:MucB/RseB C-terminal domain-containing protein [Isoalcanivorax indicus]|uniref:MucB/RseB C-terminal domain-containing protein n=1 Tax=Isoalcanivorax indicus TaxID=2202653 RepID=UPI000DB955CF|nr:MucB/RseB C-terminal domain-containing protein [Isoalcanivorax indicus]